MSRRHGSAGRRAGPQPVELASDRDCWERQPSESAAHYRGFIAYLEQGVARNLNVVATKHRWSHGHTRNVASAGRWRERAEAWDRLQQHQEAAWLAEQLPGLRRRRATAALDMYEILRRSAAAVIDDDPSAVGPKLLPQFVAAADRLTENTLLDAARVEQAAAADRDSGDDPDRLARLAVDALREHPQALDALLDALHNYDSDDSPQVR